MKVHVVGGSGFLGRHVVPILVSRHHEVTALARSDAAADMVATLGARPILGDAAGSRSLEAALVATQADGLLSLIPLSSGLGPAVVAAAERAAIRRAVFVSTTAIFTTLDAANTPARREAEAAIQASALQWTIIRPTMIYGEPGDRNLERLLHVLLRAPVVPLPRTTGRQQPVHVEDCAQTVVAALERPVAQGQCYQIAGPFPLSLRELVAQAATALNRRPLVVLVPVPPIAAMARLYERLARHPRFRAEQLARLVEDKAFDIGPARKDLGHDPRPFEVGIAQEAAVIAGH
jgi:uncharacterized protein YbjT (DUF2867 family)